MEFKEHQLNHYTKELSTTDRYLLRIIKRYFGIEELNNASSIQAIITESIARYKTTINYNEVGVTSLNKEVGILNINMDDLNGEKLFEKFSAFNKDFGTTAETITEGNDKRLTNEREPNLHSHKIQNITNLREVIDDLIKELVLYSNHIHKNMAIINKLRYTGTNFQLDLKQLESVGSIVATLINSLEIKRAQLISQYNEKDSVLDDLINQIYLLMQRFYGYITSVNDKLEKELLEYTDDKVLELLSPVKEKLSLYADKNLSNHLIDILRKSEFLITRNEIPMTKILSTIDTSNDMLTVYNNASMIGIYKDVITYYTEEQKKALWTFDETLKTFVCNENRLEHISLISPNKYNHYNHEVTLSSSNPDNDIISILLAINDSGESLGHVYPLTLNISTGIDATFNVAHNFSVIYGYQTEAFAEIAYDPTFNVDNNWNESPEGIRVRIERKNNIINIYRSELNDPGILSETPCITIDMNQFEILSEIANTPSNYGYGCMFQQFSKFTNVLFEGYKEISLLSNVLHEEVIDTSILFSNCLLDTIEVEAELIYNDIRTPLPYITKELIIEHGKAESNAIYIRISPLNINGSLGPNGILIPPEISIGTIAYNVYAKKSIPYLI